VKYAFIQQNTDNHDIKLMCDVLSVSRSGYYDWHNRKPSDRALESRVLINKIKKVFSLHKGRYGSPRIHASLNDDGISVSQGRVERLMRRAGLAATRSKRHKRIYVQREQQQAAPNHLDRQFKANRPNEKWAGDITFIPTRQGYLYLAVVVDLYSRAIIGWAMSARINGQLVLDALGMAIAKRNMPEGVLVHTDQGSQYTAEKYRALLRKHNMICSMSRKGECQDNAVAESFFHTLKEELVKDSRFVSLREAKHEIFKYIEIYYNRQRIHSTLGYKTPYDYERINAVA